MGEMTVDKCLTHIWLLPSFPSDKHIVVSLKSSITICYNAPGWSSTMFCWYWQSPLINACLYERSKLKGDISCDLNATTTWGILRVESTLHSNSLLDILVHLLNSWRYFYGISLSGYLPVSFSRSCFTSTLPWSQPGKLQQSAMLGIPVLRKSLMAIKLFQQSNNISLLWLSNNLWRLRRNSISTFCRSFILLKPSMRVL